jgi:NAD(P)-dependent dehydrogenase (short-subunit alcohol dehydrogenase family)
MRSVVITGTSSGIGWSTAKVLAENGFRVFGSVRKWADAERLKSELGPQFQPLLFDVTDQVAVQTAASTVRAALGGHRLAALVNNAGIAPPSPLLDLSIEDFRYQIDTNLVGAVIAFKCFAPLLGTDPNLPGSPGRIINISSISGEIGTPFLAAYSASKFAIEGLSESLRRELLPFGIDVIVIVPGPVATPIWEKAATTAPGQFRDAAYATALRRIQMYIEYGKRGMPPERVGAAVMRAITTPRPKIRYEVFSVPLLYRLCRALPSRLVDRLLGRLMGRPLRDSPQ